MTTTDLAVPQPAALPSMYESVDNADRQLPSVYLLQGLSQAVQNGIGKPGQVIVGLGADDPDPDFLITDPAKDSFTAYVLDRRRSWARYPQGGQIEWLTQDEFNEARLANERDVWENWHYTICVPEIDEIVPMRLMLSRTAGRKAAKNLNFIIDKLLAMGQMPVARFSVTEMTSKQTGSKFHALMVTSTEASTEGLEAAAKQQQYFGGTRAQDDRPALAASTNQPDI